MVGYALTLYFFAIATWGSFSASQSAAIIELMSSCTLASVKVFSSMRLHGPHHVAKKSMKTYLFSCFARARICSYDSSLHLTAASAHVARSEKAAIPTASFVKFTVASLVRVR
jgi:hypothetical protein